VSVRVEGREGGKEGEKEGGKGEKEGGKEKRGFDCSLLLCLKYTHSYR
jgi:hypothetical protein